MIALIFVALSGADIELSPPSGSAQEAVQQAVDKLARDGGGKLLLAPGTYRVASIKLPFTLDRRYGGIQIEGKGGYARIAPAGPGTEALVKVGVGWKDWRGLKLTGLAFRRIQFDGMASTFPKTRSLLTVEADDGTIVEDCEFLNSTGEAFICGGATSSVNGVIRHCRAKGCGRVPPANNPLSAYNLNGMNWRGEDLFAADCGWGAELGGTGVRLERSYFRDATVVIGSSNYGVCDVEVSNCLFVRSSIGWGNGIGRIADIRLRDCTLIESAVGPCGGLVKDNVDPAQVGGMPWSDRPSLVSGCQMHVIKGTTQAVRLTDWHDRNANGPGVIFKDNWFFAPPGRTIAMQGRLKADATFTGNRFNAVDLGTIYTGLPDGTPLPNTVAHLKFRDNRFPKGASIAVSGNTKGWPKRLPIR